MPICPGFDITSYWARSGLLSMTRDAGAPPTWPVAGSGDNATAVGLYSAIVTALYRRERTGKGSYVTTSLLAEGVWAGERFDPGRAVRAPSSSASHDRKNPANAAMNVYRRRRRYLVRSHRHLRQAGGGGESDRPPGPADRSAVLRPAKLMANMPQLTAILDEVFGAQPMAHWHDVFSGVHVTFGAVTRTGRGHRRSAAAARTTSSFRSRAPAAS